MADRAGKSKTDSHDAASMREKIARDNHTEIERKRRSKMAGYYQEMADHVPACRSQNRKPDKLTIMKLAIDHINEMGHHGGSDSFLSDQELETIIAQVINGFVVCVQLDSAIITKVSATCVDVVGIPPTDLYSAPFLNFVYPDDIAKVKEFFSSQMPQRRSVDLRSGTLRRETRNESLVNSRRILLCRFRCYNDREHFCVVHISGTITQSEQGPTMVCLIRRCESPEDDPRFMSTKYDSLTNITFIDAKMSEILGYAPAALIGKSVLEVCHPDDRMRLKMSLDQAIELRGSPTSLDCRLIASNGSCILFKMRHSAFLNPHSGVFEFLVGYNHFFDYLKLPDCADVYPQDYSLDPSMYYDPYYCFKEFSHYPQYEATYGPSWEVDNWNGQSMTSRESRSNF